MPLPNQASILLAGRPWTIISASRTESQKGTYDTLSHETALLLGWDVLTGVEIFAARLPCLKFTAMQPRPIGVELLAVDDLSQVRPLITEALERLLKQ